MKNKMEVHDLQQGTAEWHEFRLEHNGASESASMLGLSKYSTRSELLKMKHTGIAKEYDDWFTENILDKGHETEIKARAIMETMLQLDLYPITCSRGKFSCSCDGATFDYKVIFEHKQWNAELAAMVEAEKVPDSHMPQLQQILMVTGAEKVFFVVSDGTKEHFRYVIVKPSPIWFKKIEAGWNQFEADLVDYEIPEVKEMPTADPIKDLPVLLVEIKGEVTYNNMADFKAAARQQLDKVPEKPITDEDFVNTKAFIKSAIEVEARIKTVKKAMQEQNASINDMYNAMDEVSDEYRTKRLTAEKLVKREEEGRKIKIVTAGKVAFDKHKTMVEKTIRPIKLEWCTDAGIVISTKNKKTPESMQEAVNVALAQAMVAVTTEGQAISDKLEWAKEYFADFPLLFTDLQEIIQKPMEDYQLLIKSRIQQHAEDVEKHAAKVVAPPKPVDQGGAYLPTANAQKDTKQKVDDVLLASARNDVFLFGNKYKDVPQLADVLVWMKKFIEATEPITEKEPF